MKQKYHYFTHPAQDYTNSYPYFNKRDDVKNRGDQHQEQEKVNKGKKQDESQKKAD